MKKIQKTLIAVVIGFMTLTVSANPNGGEQEYLKKAESKYIAHNIEGAISDLSKAIEINPSFVDAYIKRADYEMEIKDFKNANADYNAAYKLDPTQSSALLNKGISEVKLEKYTDAVKNNGCFSENKRWKYGGIFL